MKLHILLLSIMLSFLVFSVNVQAHVIDDAYQVLSGTNYHSPRISCKGDGQCVMVYYDDSSPDLKVIYTTNYFKSYTSPVSVLGTRRVKNYDTAVGCYGTYNYPIGFDVIYDENNNRWYIGYFGWHSIDLHSIIYTDKYVAGVGLTTHHAYGTIGWDEYFWNIYDDYKVTYTTTYQKGIFIEHYSFYPTNYNYRITNWYNPDTGSTSCCLSSSTTSPRGNTHGGIGMFSGYILRKYDTTTTVKFDIVAPNNCDRETEIGSFSYKGIYFHQIIDNTTLRLYYSKDAGIYYRDGDLSATNWKEENIYYLYTGSGEIVAMDRSEGSDFICFQMMGSSSDGIYCYMEAPENILNWFCGLGSWLTGSPIEGGCLIVALFVLAIAVSIIGWIFHYYEAKLQREISNKYLITGGIVLIFLVMFMFVGMVDLLTGIISMFVIIALLIIFEERTTAYRGR